MKNSIIAVIAGLISLQALGEAPLSQNKTVSVEMKNTYAKQILSYAPANSKLTENSFNNFIKSDSQKLLIQRLLEKEKLINSTGGGDAGGGNLLNGRPIESYSVDVKNSPEMKKALLVLGPLMHVDFNDLSSELDFVVHKKTWYLVPIPLSKIPSSELGVNFPTKQGALQDFEEIWIDKELFNKMSFNDRVFLLVHEIYMGIKIFSYESYSQQCEINKPFNIDCLKYKSFQDRKLLNISPDDYQDVRRATTTVVKNFSDLESGNYWNNIKSMKSNIYDTGGFDSDFLNPSVASISLHDFTDMDIINALKNQKSVKGFPKFCNHKIVENLGNHYYRMKAQIQSEIVLKVANNNDVTLNVKSTEIVSGKVIINNSYNYNIPKSNTHSLTLGFNLNTPGYFMTYFVGVAPAGGEYSALGAITVGLDADLNVSSLALATLDSEISGVLTGKDMISCLEKEDYICSGVNCLR